MADLQLSLAITRNPRTWPIIDGRAQADGIDFTKTVLGPAEMFWRQLNFAEFDVSEISMSELMMIRSRGDDRFVGIPVFTTRRFYHTMMLVRKDAGIAAPPTSRASASACRNTCRPPHCGPAAFLKTSSASRPRI